MTWYSSIEEVNAALIELEEHERTVSTDKAKSEKPSRRDVSGSISSPNGPELANGVEENGGSHEVTGDSDSDSGSSSVGQEGRDGEEEVDELNRDDESDSEADNDDDDDDVGQPASDEDEVHVRQKVAEVDPQEAAEFDKEFKALMQESLESRKLELRARPTLNMMIPMNVLEGSSRGENGEEALEEGGGNKEVRVKVLVKRGNKQQTKQMSIPHDCSLIQSTKEKEAAEQEEKQDIKRLILEYNDREEELNGLGSHALNSTQGGSGRMGGAWGRSGWRGGGTRQRPHGHSSGGLYYNRRK